MKTEEDIKKAVEVMRKGGVILYPTDTVWGIGCDATNAEAVAKVYKIKHRDDSKALICLVDSDNRLQRYVRNVPDVAWQLFECADKPTTVILDGAVNLAENLIADDGSIAMRITSEPFSKELCYRFRNRLFPHRRISPANLRHRTTATSRRRLSTPWITYAGHADRSISPISRRASSSSEAGARCKSYASNSSEDVFGARIDTAL